MTEPAAKPKTRAEELAAQGYKIAPCKGCQQPVLWAQLEGGKWIPLSTRIPVYTPVTCRGEWFAVRNLMNFASHFVDCPNREIFKKAK